MKMRKLAVFCLAAAVLLPAIARADLTVKEETQMDGLMGMLSSKGVETTYIKGEKMRAETKVEMGGMIAGMMEGAQTSSPSDVVTITRLDKGLIWLVDNADSTYMEMSLKGSKAESSSAHFKVKDISVKKTAQTKTILGDKCDGVEVDITIEAASQTQSVKSLFWMRPEVKDMVEMRHFWDAMVDVARVSQGDNPMGEVMTPVFAKIKEIPGVPLGIEMSMTTPMGGGGDESQQAEMKEALKMMQQMTKEEGAPPAEEPSTPVNEIRVTRYVTSMSKAPLSDALFEIPKGYRKVESMQGMFSPTMMEGE